MSTESTVITSQDVKTLLRLASNHVLAAENIIEGIEKHFGHAGDPVREIISQELAGMLELAQTLRGRVGYGALDTWLDITEGKQ
jgi:hypothetical protein